MNEYFVKVKLYRDRRFLGTKCFIFDAESGKEAVHLVQEYVEKKQNSIFINSSKKPDDFELLDIHKL